MNSCEEYAKYRAEFSFGFGLTVEWKRIMEGPFSLRAEHKAHRSCSILLTRWKMPISNRINFSRFFPNCRLSGAHPRSCSKDHTHADSCYQIHTSKLTTNQTPRPCGPQLPSNFPSCKLISLIITTIDQTRHYTGKSSSPAEFAWGDPRAPCSSQVSDTASFSPMSQYSFSKFDDFTCSGPRPPVPGEESRRKVNAHIIFVINYV